MARSKERCSWGPHQVSAIHLKRPLSCKPEPQPLDSVSAPEGPHFSSLIDCPKYHRQETQSSFQSPLPPRVFQILPAFKAQIKSHLLQEVCPQLPWLSLLRMSTVPPFVKLPCFRQPSYLSQVPGILPCPGTEHIEGLLQLTRHEIIL